MRFAVGLIGATSVVLVLFLVLSDSGNTKQSSPTDTIEEKSAARTNQARVSEPPKLEPAELPTPSPSVTDERDQQPVVAAAMPAREQAAERRPPPVLSDRAPALERSAAQKQAWQRAEETTRDLLPPEIAEIYIQIEEDDCAESVVVIERMTADVEAGADPAQTAKDYGELPTHGSQIPDLIPDVALREKVLLATHDDFVAGCPAYKAPVRPIKDWHRKMKAHLEAKGLLEPSDSQSR